MGFSMFEVLPRVKRGPRAAAKPSRDGRDWRSRYGTRTDAVGVSCARNGGDSAAAEQGSVGGAGFDAAASVAAVHVAWCRLSVARGGLGHTRHLVQEHQRAQPAFERRCRQRDSDGVCPRGRRPTSASIILQYGGTTFQSQADGPWSGIPTNSGVITFEDPNDEISGSTLAIGGGWGGGASSTVNGHTFSGILARLRHLPERGELEHLVPPIAQLLARAGARDRSRHRVGTHPDRRQHSERALEHHVSLVLRASNTPTPPAIGPDDLDGLTFIYPVTGTPCTFSLNPTSASWAAARWRRIGGSRYTSWAARGRHRATPASSASVPAARAPDRERSSYSVASSSAITTRTGTLTIAGQTFTVNQAAGCGYALTPSSASIPAAGGLGSVSVTAPDGLCVGGHQQRLFCQHHLGDDRKWKRQHQLPGQRERHCATIRHADDCRSDVYDQSVRYWSDGDARQDRRCATAPRTAVRP